MTEMVAGAWMTEVSVCVAVTTICSSVFIASLASLNTIAQDADGPDGPLELVEITVRDAFAEVRENEALYRNKYEDVYRYMHVTVTAANRMF